MSAARDLLPAFKKVSQLPPISMHDYVRYIDEQTDFICVRAELRKPGTLPDIDFTMSEFWVRLMPKSGIAFDKANMMIAGLPGVIPLQARRMTYNNEIASVWYDHEAMRNILRGNEEKPPALDAQTRKRILVAADNQDFMQPPAPSAADPITIAVAAEYAITRHPIIMQNDADDMFSYRPGPTVLSDGKILALGSFQ